MTHWCRLQNRPVTGARSEPWDGDTMCRVTPRSEGTGDWGGWPPWAWPLWALGLIGGVVVVVLVTAFVGLRAGSACGEPLRPDDIANAQRTLLVVAGLAFAPWLVVALATRWRWRFVVPGLVCAAPALWQWWLGRDPSTYADLFCF